MTWNLVEFLKYLFDLIGEYISVSMTWKIIGNLSLTHFILGFILVVGVLKFITMDLFGHMNLLELTDTSMSIYNNVENKKEKGTYYRRSKSNKSGKVYVTDYYKVNKKTGKEYRV